MPVRIYHITDRANLASICADGGLSCLNTLLMDGIDYVSIAHNSIQDTRATTPVPCGPGGVLHDYVPFYFSPRSPMLYAINKGWVAGYPNGQKDVVYLVSSAEAIRDYGCGFAFTDGHGIVQITEFFDDLDHLEKVDWEIMKSRYWNDTNEDGDRKRRRQAEFLVRDFVPLELIDEIAVMRPSQVDAVKAINPNLMPDVKAQPAWYY